MSFVKSTIISLHTDKIVEGCILEEKLTKNLHIASKQDCIKFSDVYNLMHLYFIVDSEDEKIDYDDWYLVELFDISGGSTGFHLEQCKMIEGVWVNNWDITTTRHIDNCKKVIATTDSLLVNKGILDSSAELLPHPTNEFLYRFCQEKTLDKVLVALSTDYSSMPEDENEIHLPWRAYVDYKVKTSDDNEISIAPLKQHYNRDEVTQLLRKFAEKIDKLYNEHTIEYLTIATDEYNKNKNNFLDT